MQNISFPIFLTFFTAFIIFFQIKLRFNKKDEKNAKETIKKREEEANYIRKKELPKEFFFVPDFNILNLDKPEISDKVLKARETVIKKSKLEMLKLDKKYSNLELKETFGANNLDKVIMFEEHLNMFISSLNDWAESLLAETRDKEAEDILTYAVAIGSDYSKTYKLLSDIYKKSNHNKKLDILRENIENNPKLEDSLIKDKIIDYTNY